MMGDDLEHVIQAHDAEVLQELDDRRAGALELGNDFLILQIVHQPVFFDEREQWI
jgi:hypothetical protein